LNYYVYYKLDPSSAERSRAKVEAIFRTIERQLGVRGRWMRRRDDPGTFMEVYEGVRDAQAFETLLEKEGAQLGVARKVERFVSA
jgi:hypothetical protein